VLKAIAIPTRIEGFLPETWSLHVVLGQGDASHVQLLRASVDKNRSIVISLKIATVKKAARRNSRD
jgi:hypothetical protein